MTAKAYCLCAEWCTVCRDLRTGFQAWVNEGRAIEWVDIEEQPAWEDEVEVTAFPFVVIKDGHLTLFAGALEPQLLHIQRLLASYHVA